MGLGVVDKVRCHLRRRNISADVIEEVDKILMEELTIVGTQFYIPKDNIPYYENLEEYITHTKRHNLVDLAKNLESIVHWKQSENNLLNADLYRTRIFVWPDTCE